MSTSSKIPPAATWDLESLFPGGSKSAEFEKHRAKVKANLQKGRKLLDNMPKTLNESSLASWIEVVNCLQTTVEDTELIVSFAECLACQDVSDHEANAFTSEGMLYYSQWEKLATEFDALAADQPNEEWSRLTSHTDMESIRFYLDERRSIARSMMPVAQEALALDLGVNGFHSWNQIYDKMAGEAKVDFTENGTTETISLGQLATKFGSSDRAIRSQAFEKLTGAWQSRADLAGMMLNSLAGFRLSLYENRGWGSPKKETLMMNRLQQKTLDAMWNVVKRETPRLKPFIEAKKTLLGIDKFRWYDESAPCGDVEKLFPFDEAGDLIVQHAGAFSTELGEFCRMAFDKRWIEAEDRPGKAGGGWCTGTGAFRQTRIFMTYTGTYENLLTLAHELGHSYHSHVLKDKPFHATEYPMNLAETASNFMETLMTDACLKAINDPKEKLMLLEQKIQAAFTMFCNLHSRYIFDTNFYDERKSGVISKDRLCELMVNAQKEAFGDLLDESGYHPYFWCSKLHFYLTGQPFYNFPYTFGFLFAGGVYDRAAKEGPAFAEKYKALLADTGSMNTEELAKKHLDVDLTEEAFWVDAVNRALADVDEFVKLAGQV